MAEKTKAYLRGFLAPYPFTVDDVVYGFNNTTITTYEPIADIPTPDRPTGMFVGATGGTVSDADLQVLTSRSGSSNTAEYTIKDNADSTSVIYGNIQASFITDWVNLKPRTVQNSYYYQDIVSDDDGGYITVYERVTSTGILSVRHTGIDNQGNTTDGQVALVGSTITIGSQGKPCITKLPDGSYICCVFFVNDSDLANIRVYRSLDGESFTLASRDALDETIDVSSGKYRIQKTSLGNKNGQVLLVVSADTADTSYTKRNHLLQYVSIDGGATFKRVTLNSELDTFSFQGVTIITTQNQLALTYIGATDEVHFMVLPHAFHSAYSLRTSGKFIKINSAGSAGDFAGGTDDNMEDGWTAGNQNPNGDTYIYVFEKSDNAIVCFFSSDLVNWASMLTNASPSTEASVFYVDTSDGIQNFSSCTYRGGSALAHSWTTTNFGRSVGVLYLGGFVSGFSTPYRINVNTKQYPITRQQTTYTWLPLLRLQDSSELTKSGGGSETLSTSYSTLTVTSSQTDLFFSRTGTIASARQGTSVFGELTVVNDITDTVPTILELDVEISTGNYWQMRVEFYEGRFEVFDVGVGSTSLLNQSFNVDDGMEFVLNIWEGKASFYYRYKGHDGLRKYIEGFKNTTLTNLASGSTNQNLIKFGLEGSPAAGTAECRIHKLLVSDASAVQDMSNIVDGDIIGARFSTNIPTYVDAGIGIFAQKGPTYIGDEWNIKATSNHAIDNIFHNISPSPRVQWHSAEVSAGDPIATTRLAIQLSTSVTDIGNDLVGLHLANINFRDAALQYWDGSAWQTVFTFETSEGMKHGYTRTGKSIKQNASVVHDESYYFYNELKGYVAMCVSGDDTEFYRVQSNTEGAFGNASGKLCSVILDGEPTFDGIVYFIPTDVTVVANLNGADGAKWAINFPQQKTIDDQLRIGNMFLGPIAITGTQYSKGRKISIQGGNIVTVTPDRTRYSKAYAPEQRSVQIAWSDGVDQSSFYDDAPDPDYYKSSSTGGAEPVSVYQDAPYLLEGLLRGLQGSQTPMVYLPSITTTDDNRVYNRRAEHLLGVIDSEINIESITGDELVGDGTGEVMRVGTISIVEVV